MWYKQRVWEVEQASFTPLIFTITGGMGDAVTQVYKRLSNLLSTKHSLSYGVVMGWVLGCRWVRCEGSDTIDFRWCDSGIFAWFQDSWLNSSDSCLSNLEIHHVINNIRRNYKVLQEYLWKFRFRFRNLPSIQCDSESVLDPSVQCQLSFHCYNLQ